MFASHPSRRLAAYVDGELPSAVKAGVESHLAGCARCRGELERIGAGAASLGALPLAQAPDQLWGAIESSLERPEPRRNPSFRWRLAAAVAGLTALLSAFLWFSQAQRGEQWEVLRLAGSPSVASRRIESSALIRGGESIETDGASRARLQVGEIGSVEVEPNTRITVLTANPREHRLGLRGGAIAAKILAPPRLFFVETAAGTAIDLGCEYTLQCDSSGFGVLRVQAGWVSFEGEGRESLVPAGAVCRLRPAGGPGTPYFGDAPESLVEALDVFDFHGGGEEAVTAILAASRARDTLTLWHLLSRVDPRDRARVYERMAALSPPPEGLSRQRLLELDPESLTRWREELAWIW